MDDVAKIAESLTDLGRSAILNLSGEYFLTAREAGAYSATITKLRTPPMREDLSLVHGPLVTTDYRDTPRLQRTYRLTEIGVRVRAHLKGMSDE